VASVRWLRRLPQLNARLPGSYRIAVGGADRNFHSSRADPDRGDDILGPMATAVMGGLLVATVLTLIFLPALYVAWFRIKEPSVRAGF
jgi:AcrB/AcrD/AcrF family